MASSALALVSQEALVAEWCPKLLQEGKSYRKFAKMHAKQAAEAGVLETWLQGELESRKEYVEGDYIVHGTEGERYTMDAASFTRRYDVEHIEPAETKALQDEVRAH